MKPFQPRVPHVHVGDDPVGVVGQRIDGLDRKKRPLEGGHPVEGDGGCEELEDGVGAHLVPGPAQREQAVQHSAPGRRPEHQGEGHPEGLQPAGQRRVQQVVGPGPDVDEHQRPEVDDRQPVRVDRAPRRLRQKVIHDAEDRSREEERHGVVPVPPLHEGVLDAAEDGVAVRPARRYRQVVDDVEHRHRDDGRDVEPDRHVQARLAPDRQGPEEIDGEDDPDQDDGDVDGPDELPVLLPAREPQGQRERSRDDDRLPAPEMQLREKIARQPRLDQALRRIVDAGEHHVAHKGKDHRVGVQRPDPAPGEPRRVEIKLPEIELGGDQDPHKHSHRSPYDTRQKELADDLIVELYRDLTV